TRHDVRMVELAHHQPLAMHALHEARVLGDVAEKHLEGHGTIEADLMCLVDRAHGALAQLLEQAEIAEHRAFLILLGRFGPGISFLAGHACRPDWSWSLFHALYHNRPRSRCHALCNVWRLTCLRRRGVACSRRLLGPWYLERQPRRRRRRVGL